MILYGYWRSSSAYRVRIALGLKGVAVEHRFVHLTRDGGEQHKPDYRAINPQGRVPSLVLDDGSVLTQSPAIIEYLDEIAPAPPLLPTGPVARAQVRAVASILGADIQPLHNLAPLSYLRRTLGQDEPAVTGWIRHWIGAGLDAVEALIPGGPWCFGPEPGLADLYLLPQLYAARRFGLPLDAYPKILAADEAAARHPAFMAAHPSAQPDAE